RCRRSPGSSAVWEELLERVLPDFSRIVWRAAARWGLHNRADVDDLLQDICLKICELIQSESRPELEEFSLAAYLNAVAVNSTRDWLRRRLAHKRDVGMTRPLDDHLESLAEQISSGENPERQTLIRQVNDLLEGSQRDRSVF